MAVARSRTLGCEAEALDRLRSAGHKLTPQRMLVLRSIRHASGHTTAARILDEVRAAYPYVDVSTVYRTLAVLKDMRLVSETQLGGGDAIFEWVGADRHHHLVCRGCDSLARLDHRFLTKLVDDLEAEIGFRADVNHFAIFGLCANCQSKAETD